MDRIPVDALFFDFDGTLGDTRQGICNAWKRTIAEAKVECPDFARIFRVGPPADMMAKLLFPDFPEAEQAEMARRYKANYDGSDMAGEVPFPWSEKLLNHFFAANKKIYVVTYKRMVSTLRLIRCYGFEKYFSGIKGLIKGEGFWSIGISLVTTLVNCALFFFIAYTVTMGEGKIGDYSLYTGALTSIASSVAVLVSTTSSIYEGTLFIDNMIVFMNEKSKITPTVEEPLSVERHKGHIIEFENVSFRYPGTKRDVLKNISFKIEQGDTVVLVGLNGAGKTTLLKLLTRLYDPTEGRVLLDGRDIREYSLDELYAMFGVIFQDFGKYAFTVSENIAFGDVNSEIDNEKVRDSAKASSADTFIDALPKGYDTPLMRVFELDGIEPSIGQWQKIAIARAFYSDSDVLILDEPTASLDAIAEQEIFNQFDLLRKEKTTVFVSHRLSSATIATKILVLNNGELVEEGNHSELMQKKGVYYELFTTQANRYIAEENNI